MGFYYAREKQKFDAEWERLSAWYQAEGMSAEAIRELYQYDWAVFCRQRSFENRTQPLPEEPASVLYQKFAQLTTMMTDTDLRGRYDWIESLDDEELAGRLSDLKGRGVAIKEGFTLKDLYDERVPLYEKYADVTVDLDGTDIAGALRRAGEALKG